MIRKEGSVRVDLLGGTLDIHPIGLVLTDVVTLNLATSLKAKVCLEKSSEEGIEILSKDYNSNNFFKKNEFTPENLRSDHFGPMKFVCQILDLFGIHSGLKLSLESGSPAGAGLGGSSTMGVTLYNALSEFKNKDLNRQQAIIEVNHIEARILDGPAGYQDYYPALYGGVLALQPTPGLVNVEQLYTPELKSSLESRLTLVYSGKTRLSGINNWEVYKSFFDKAPHCRNGLTEIARLSLRAYKCIKEGQFDELIDLIAEEGTCRKNLFPGIVSSEMDSLYNELRAQIPEVGMKVCGAGGGGCFLLTHKESSKTLVRQMIKDAGMSLLDFQVDAPI